MQRRRLLLGTTAAIGVALSARAASLPGVAGRPIGPIGPIGLGSWVSFNVGEDPALRARCTDVLRAFVDEGGGLLDSSPMYGSAEAVIGHGLRALGHPGAIFTATKVWSGSPGEGVEQLAQSFRLWGVPRFGLVQVHNLLGWQHHLPMLLEQKAAGRIAAVGVTTSHGRRHDALEKILSSQPIDFVQLTYNVADRDAESRLLPLAAERGVVVIANRPFRRAELIRRLAGRPIPDWAIEAFDARSWPQLLLKWIVSHPARVIPIPATSNVAHLRENMAAGRGAMPEAGARSRLLGLIGSL